MTLVSTAERAILRVASRPPIPCKAWEEQKNEGRELGERQKIISQIVKKLQKDKSVAEIADDLEEKEEVIAPIYEAALSMKPDYDVEKIYELLEKNKKLA